MTNNIDNGIVNLPSNHSVDETFKKLNEILGRNGISIFIMSAKAPSRASDQASQLPRWGAETVGYVAWVVWLGVHIYYGITSRPRSS